jgi:hypothetical protein
MTFANRNCRVSATVIAVLLSACSLKHVEPPKAGPDKAAILHDRLAWLNDSTPVVRFATPFVYGLWKLEMEHCSGRHKEGWPRFYVAPIAPLHADGRIAFYAQDTKAIVFGLGEEVNPFTVRHELLHWLLDPWDPRDAHPAEYFAEKCGLYVTPNP